MKIGVLIDELMYGGFQKVALEEVIAFRSAGYEADLLVLRKTDRGGFEDIIKKNQIYPIYLNNRIPRWLDFNFKFPLFAFFSFFHIRYPFILPFYYKKNEYDILIVHGTYTAFTAISLKKWKSVPYVAFIHDSIDYILKQRYRGRLLGNIYKYVSFVGERLDMVIVKNAQLVIAFPDMIKHLKGIYPKYKYYYNIGNGCTPIEEDNINYNKDLYWIAETRWDENKNPSFLLEVRKLLKNKLPLKILGRFTTPGLQERLQNEIISVGLGDTVSIIGPLPQDELDAYRARAYGLVHPCREAFGMTILEAAAHGCPSIIANNSGVCELFSDQLREIQPIENNISSYVKSIDYITSLSKEDYDLLLRSYYDVAKQNSREKHIKIILSLIKK